MAKSRLEYWQELEALANRRAAMDESGRGQESLPFYAPPPGTPPPGPQPGFVSSQDAPADQRVTRTGTRGPFTARI